MKVFFLIFLLLSLPWILTAQDFQIGKSYFGSSDYVEYIPGNLPLIITVPHGGDLLPASIPDRNCSICVSTKDAFTRELAMSIKSYYQSESACLPHFIINHLHRRKMDANREIVEAANGNPDATNAWNEFHQYIRTARKAVLSNYSSGLQVDLHGHGHDNQRIELGYLLQSDELSKSESSLNALSLIGSSSIKNLIFNNLQKLDHASILRGNSSLGQILEVLGFPTVPSKEDPFPLSHEPYFSGGFNTQIYGSRDSGQIDAIQVECNRDIRFETDERVKFAKGFSLSLNEYLKVHYDVNLDSLVACDLSVVTDDQILSENIYVYPNPSRNLIHIEGIKYDSKIIVINDLGQQVLSKMLLTSQSQIDISGLSCGLYHVKFENKHYIKALKLVVPCE